LANLVVLVKDFIVLEGFFLKFFEFIVFINDHTLPELNDFDEEIRVTGKNIELVLHFCPFPMIKYVLFGVKGLDRSFVLILRLNISEILEKRVPDFLSQSLFIKKEVNKSHELFGLHLLKAK
jgi:hypothetical protein